MTARAISDRPASDDDYDALYALHVATMKDYVAATYGWDDDVQRQMFHDDWADKLPQLRVIVLDDAIVGAFRAEDRPGEIVVASIEVDPLYQGRGIGTRVVEQLVERAGRQNKTVTLQVMKANPRARALYERLGFAATGETGTHIEMAEIRGGS